MLGWWAFRAVGFWGLRVVGLQGFGVSVWWSCEVLGFWGGGVLGFLVVTLVVPDTAGPALRHCQAGQWGLWWGCGVLGLEGCGAAGFSAFLHGEVVGFQGFGVVGVRGCGVLGFLYGGAVRFRVGGGSGLWGFGVRRWRGCEVPPSPWHQPRFQQVASSTQVLLLRCFSGDGAAGEDSWSSSGALGKAPQEGLPSPWRWMGGDRDATL